MSAGRYVVRVVPFGGPSTQLTEQAPDSVSAICRAMQRLYPGGEPHGFVAVVGRADDDVDDVSAACVRCGGRGHDDGRVCDCHAGDEYREVRP